MRQLAPHFKEIHIATTTATIITTPPFSTQVLGLELSQEVFQCRVAGPEHIPRNNPLPTNGSSI